MPTTSDPPGTPASSSRGGRVLLLDTAAPDRPNGSMVRYAAMVGEALARHAPEWDVGRLALAPPEAGLARFPGRLRTLLRYLLIARRARRLLPRARADVLHLLDGSYAFVLDPVRRLPAPLVVTLHDFIPALTRNGDVAGPRPGRAGVRVIRRAMANLQRADGWIADSASTRADAVRLAGLDARCVHVVHPAVARVAPGRMPAAASGRAPFILHVAGNNTPYKNRAGAVAVFARVRAGCEARLVLAGAAPDAALRAAVAGSGVADAVAFATDLAEPELAALYRDAALLLFPSFYEGFGWPPLEAMMQGCPAVCSNAGSLPEIVGDAALTAAPHDIEALAGHCLRLLQEPDLRARLADAGRRRVGSFTLEAMGRGLGEAYGKTLKR